MAEIKEVTFGRAKANDEIAENLRTWNKMAKEGKLQGFAAVGIELDGSVRFWWHHGNNSKALVMGALEIVKWRIMDDGGEVTEVDTGGEDIDEDPK